MRWQSLNSGMITQAEIDWLLSQQDCLTRAEQAAVPLHRRELNEWSEPPEARQLNCAAIRQA